AAAVRASLCRRPDQRASRHTTSHHTTQLEGRLMSGHILDLTKYAFVRRLGDITVYGTWVGPSVDESEPCLVLVPTHRINGCRPIVVALSAAYKYDDPRYL